MLQNFPIQEDIYTKNSLKDDIEKISDVAVSINLESMLNITIKALYAYRHEGATNESIPFDDVAEYCKTLHNIIQVHDSYISQSKFANDDIAELEDMFGEEYKFYFFHQYALRMHADFASSTEICMDIISRKLEDTAGNKKYFGLDFGSGSGLLTIAQYIQARRNNFDDITNIGLELIIKQQQISHRLLTELDAGVILLADTTKEEIYKTLSGYNHFINFISNETIPRPGIAMSNEFDPFYPNMLHMRQYLSSHINQGTQGFPEKMEVEVRYAFYPEILEGNIENWYQLGELEEVNQLREILYSPYQTVLDETFPSKIFLNGSWKKLEEVGDDVHNLGYIGNSISLRW